MRATGEAAAQNKDIILGVKFQAGSNMNGKWSLEFLKIARELCDKYQLPMMVHISSAPPDTDQVMELMRKGDVITHCYTGHTLGILDANGKVRSSVREARARGVFFDVGHGAGSFNFPAARKALDDGFLADTISTDVYAVNINGPVFDMPTTMSEDAAPGPEPGRCAGTDHDQSGEGRRPFAGHGHACGGRSGRYRGHRGRGREPPAGGFPPMR